MNVRPLTPCELHPEQREQEEIPFRCTFNKVIPALFTRRTVAVFAQGFWFELQHRTCVWLKSLMHFKKSASVWFMVMALKLKRHCVCGVICACTLLKPQIYRHDTHTHSFQSASVSNKWKAFISSAEETSARRDAWLISPVWSLTGDDEDY